jgi:hypothetical protein
MNLAFSKPLLGLALCLFACSAPVPVEPPRAWISMLEGAALEEWEKTAFGGEGEVEVSPGSVSLGFGSPLTGLTWKGEFPRDRYEVELEATRIEGDDFFCGLTFPVGDGLCTLILGGWGGALTGLSCIDGEDASVNSTKSFRSYPIGEPVAIHLEVGGDSVRVLLDGEEVVHQSRAGHVFELRGEVFPSAPFGVASFATRARIQGLRYRALSQ